VSTNRDQLHQRTLHVRDTCLCLSLQRAARALARRFDEAFRHLDLTNGQFSLLMSLCRPKPPALGEVAALLAMDRTTMTAALKPLERRGLIQSSRNDEDKRARRLSLTAAGRELLDRAYPIWVATHREVDAAFAPSRLDAMRSDLLRLAFEAPETKKAKQTR
jgi:DNA-binding MarR family transcriptional regulator